MKLRRTVPDAVRAIPDRRLAWGLSTEGVALVASPGCLWIAEEQLPWSSVEKAIWKTPMLTVNEVAEIEGTGRSRTWELAEDSRLAELVHDRVTGSVAWSDSRALSPSGRVRLVGRRVLGQDRLLWQTVWEPGTDPGDPFLRAQVEAALDALRRSIG